ncbi:hypothetical protein [Kribbella endophytica]
MPGEESEPRDAHLSGPAEEHLRELLEDLRAEIINRAQRKAVVDTSPNREMSPADIDSAAADLGYSIRSEAMSGSGRGSSRRFIMVIGVLGSAGLAILVTYFVRNVDLSTADRWASILGGITAVAGLVLSLIAARDLKRHGDAAKLEKTPASDPRVPLAEANFLLEWANLENGIRAEVTANHDLPSQNVPLGSLLRLYATDKDLSSTEVKELRSLLQLRNELAHSRPGAQEPGRVIEAFPVLRRYLSKLNEH